jgi:MFS family permease
MIKMSKTHKLILLTFIGTSFLQMPQMGLSPAIEYIKNNVFTDRTLGEIQTAQTFLNIMVTAAALLTALLIAKNVFGKKTIAVSGLMILGAAGPLSLVMHGQYWHIWFLSGLVGAGVGCYVSTMVSIVFDNFDEEECRFASGVQASVVNIGGIVFSVAGGALVTAIWYGGYLLASLGILVGALAIFTVPGKKRPKTHGKESSAGEKPKLPPIDIFYYALITFLFFLIYIAIGTNISTHLRDAGFGDPSTAGIAIAIQMAGGVVSGIFFGKLSLRFRDMTIVQAFVAMFIGLTLLNLGQSVLILNFVGVFIAGLSLSMVFPQCVFSASRYVDPSNSSTATSIITCVAPGVGGFISPLVLTNLTVWLGGTSTTFRYQFIGFLSLACAVIFYVTTRRRMKREAGAAETTPA